MLKYFKFYYKSVIQGSTSFTIHPAAKIGYVHLRVSDIQQSLQFYHSLLGLRLVGRTSSSSESVFLSTGTDSKSPSFLIALSKVETTPKDKNDFLFLQDNRRSRKVTGLQYCFQKEGSWLISSDIYKSIATMYNLMDLQITLCLNPYTYVTMT
ncbi:MAG: VOC family protein [Candidatus Nitrosopolaris sp.]